MSKTANLVIRWTFYLLFFLVPLVFYSGSFELFEYNKMMLTYAFTIIIAAAWSIKLLTAHSSLLTPWKWIRRTPLDIPIAFYLAAHILSTIFSIDVHTSIWGHYSRFHEGLLATISYIILYYAAVSNLEKRDVFRIFYASFASGALVAIWGALEHFGGSLSCLFITGSFNDTCWIQDVKNRVFATLGQPNWMAAYLDILILTTFGFILKTKDLPNNNEPNIKHHSNHSPLISNHSLAYILLSALFFAALLFTKSRSGILGLIVGAATLIVAAWKYKQETSAHLRPLLMLLSSLLLLSLLFGLPFTQVEKFNLENLLTRKPTTNTTVAKPVGPSPYIDIGISESGDIRRIVWQGAIKIWQRYPIFGSGVETFAYAYYKDRPAEHNMVSEWDFLYNKAHNEFLNILATTGTVGMVAYLLLIGAYFWWFWRYLNNGTSPQPDNKWLIPSLVSAYASILVTNFFGFSVVIIGLFFFLIPALSTVLASVKEVELSSKPTTTQTSQWVAIGAICMAAIYSLGGLLNMWQADKAFAYGKNLDSVQQFLPAYSYLSSAVNANPDEPTFRDELSFNEATLATALFDQLKTASESAIASLSAQDKANIKIPQLGLSVNDLVTKAISDSDKTVETSPNSMPFWKTRTKTFYTLAQIDRNYLTQAVRAISTAVILAPTDAKVHYNYGIILGQVGDLTNAVKIFEQTVALKPDYRDAHYALGLYESQLGQKDKAHAQMEFIISKIGPDTEAKKWLEENK